MKPNLLLLSMLLLMLFSAQHTLLNKGLVVPALAAVVIMHMSSYIRAGDNAYKQLHQSRLDKLT